MRSMDTQLLEGSAARSTPLPPGAQGTNCTESVSPTFAGIVAEPFVLALVLMVVTMYCPSSDFTHAPFFWIPVQMLLEAFHQLSAAVEIVVVTRYFPATGTVNFQAAPVVTALWVSYSFTLKLTTHPAGDWFPLLQCWFVHMLYCAMTGSVRSTSSFHFEASKVSPAVAEIPFHAYAPQTTVAVIMMAETARQPHPIPFFQEDIRAVENI